MSQSTAPPAVVVDCMVFVQAAANEKGPAARILDLPDERKITLYVSKLILAEARYVLDRPDVRAPLSKLTDVAVEALFERLTQRATLIRQVPKRFAYRRDPKDEPYVNLAVAIKADYLASPHPVLVDVNLRFTKTVATPHTGAEVLELPIFLVPAVILADRELPDDLYFHFEFS